MKIYIRLLKYLKPYRGRMLLSVVCMICFAVFSSFSVWMIAPFLDTLFSGNTFFGSTEIAETIKKSPETQVSFNRMRTDSTSDSQERTRAVTIKKIESLRDLRMTLKSAMDVYLLRGSKMQSLRRICVVFFFLFLFKNVFGYFQAYLMAFIEQRIAKDLMDDLYTHMHRLSLRYFQKRRAGQLISRVTNDVQIAIKPINVTFTSLIRDPLLILLFMGMAIVISWKLSFIAFILLPLSLLFIVSIGRRLRKVSTLRQEQMANITSILQETVTGIRVVKAFAMEKFEIAKFLKETKHYLRSILHITRTQKMVSPVSEQLTVLVSLFILWYGGMQVIGGELISGDFFILFLACIYSMMQPVKELSNANNNIQEGLAAAERIFRVLRTTSEIEDSPDSVEMPHVRGAIAFENISFYYNEDEPVLKNIDLRVDPGEVVALVGPSGAGKSTLVDLIPRFYDPVVGSVSIDGTDVRKIRLNSLRNSMGIVTQDVILFNDTVRNNIAYGLTDNPFEKVVEAAEAANAHGFILDMPDGYETVIGDRGMKLSGGERQRISIARAILKNPPILIFDEATSSLDTESEIFVQQAIDNLMKGRTTIVIAHRLSTVQNADRIVVLNEGEIVQAGTHRELIKKDGLYKVLYDLQFRNGPR